MMLVFFVLLVGFEIKHFVADYLMQTGWMIAGKGSLTQVGGYAHAGVHVALSLVVLLLVGTPWPALLGLLVAEFVVHYALDFGKILYSRGVHVDTDPQRFWALHGVDQLAHQVTYAAMIYGALLAKGLI